MTDQQSIFGVLPTFVTHLECSLTGERYESDRLHGLSRAGGRCWCAMISTGCAAPCRARRWPGRRRSVALSRVAAGAPAREHLFARRSRDPAGVAAAHRRAAGAAAS